MEALESANYLPRPRGHDLPLNIEQQSATERSSLEWIDQHGLKSKKLNLYQVLAPNAYNPKQNYIPVLNKTVTSQIHSRAMVQFAWPDGSVKNLHVDLAELYDYQKKLRSVVELFEKRIDWLSTGSRKIFGSVAEDSVVILIDLAAANANYLIHIQHSLRLLLEQLRLGSLLNAGDRLLCGQRLFCCRMRGSGCWACVAQARIMSWELSGRR